MKLKTPAITPVKSFSNLEDEVIHIEKGQHYLIAFFRDARCPFCNYRIFELTKRYNDLAKQGIQVIAVFSAPEEDVRQFILNRPRPFPVVADPESKLHTIFGLEQGNKKLASMLSGMLKMIKGMMIVGKEAMNSDSEILPADFLINKSGLIEQTHYGKNYADRLPMNKILNFAREQRKIAA